MLEIGTSGLMSGEGKRGVAVWPEPARLSSTLPFGAVTNGSPKGDAGSAVQKATPPARPAAHERIPRHRERRPDCVPAHSGAVQRNCVANDFDFAHAAPSRNSYSSLLLSDGESGTASLRLKLKPGTKKKAAQSVRKAPKL